MQNSPYPISHGVPMTAKEHLDLLAEFRSAGMTPATYAKPERAPTTELFLHGGAWAGSIARAGRLPKPMKKMKHLPRAARKEKGLADYGTLIFDLQINLRGAGKLLESHKRGTSIQALVGFSDGCALPSVGKNKRLLIGQPHERSWILMRGRVKTAKFYSRRDGVILCQVVFLLQQQARYTWKQP